MRRTIAATELAHRLAGGWRPELVDVRTAAEWRRERIPGFRRLSLHRALRLGAGSPVVVTCRSGHRAALAAQWMGTDAYVLEGGVKGWEAAGLPIERARSSGLDRVLAVVDALGFRRWRRRIAAGAHGLVMELGAGSGRNSAFYPQDARLVAVEPDLEALRFLRASGRAPNALAVCACAEALPFCDGAFDVAVVTLVFCSVDDPARSARELVRTLKPGGEIRGAEHMLATGTLGRLQRSLAPAWRRMTGSCHLDRETLATLAGAGLSAEVRGRAFGDIFMEYTARIAGASSQGGQA